MKLRPIQQNTVNKIYYHAANGKKRILVMLPTGSGKTVIAKHLIDNCTKKGNRALFTVPRLNLIEQTAKYFDDYSIIQGDDSRFDDTKLLQIAMIQTLANRDVSTPDLIIFDEIHYAFDGELIQSIFRKFPDAFFIGLSATPTDEKGYLLDGFDAIIDDVQLGDMIQQRWLAPIDVYSDSVDLSSVRITDGEYNTDDVDNVVCRSEVVGTVYDNYMKHAAGLKFICFAASVKHGQLLTYYFKSKGVRCEFVSAETHVDIRNKYYSDMQAGRITGLINVEILTAGYDEPTIECCIMAVPTKSWRKYIQCVGRAVRLNGATYEESILNGKEKAILIDCGNLIAEHGMPTDRKKLIFKPKMSHVIDRELGISDDVDKRKDIILTKEKQLFLKKIGSLLDLYDGKVYAKENELQTDVNSFLKKTGWFWWRQNSGKAYISGRWVHFASKAGLPDNTLFFDFSSLFIGIELKLPKVSLTDHQKETIPEMLQKGVLVFFAESIFDVWLIIKHIEENTTKTDDGLFISNKIYERTERQMYFIRKFKLEKYLTK